MDRSLWPGRYSKKFVPLDFLGLGTVGYAPARGKHEIGVLCLHHEHFRDPGEGIGPHPEFHEKLNFLPNVPGASPKIGGVKGSFSRASNRGVSGGAGENPTGGEPHPKPSIRSGGRGGSPREIGGRKKRKKAESGGAGKAPPGKKPNSTKISLFPWARENRERGRRSSSGWGFDWMGGSTIRQIRSSGTLLLHEELKVRSVSLGNRSGPYTGHNR